MIGAQLESEGGYHIADPITHLALPWWCLFAPELSEQCHPTLTLPAAAGVTAPAAPQTLNQMTLPGAWTTDEAIAWTNEVARQRQAATTATYQTNPGGAAASPDSSQAPAQFSWVPFAVAGGALALVLLLKR